MDILRPTFAPRIITIRSIVERTGVKIDVEDDSRKVLLKEGEGTSPKYPGAGDAHASSNPGGGDDRRGGDRDRGPRRDRDRGPRR